MLTASADLRLNPGSRSQFGSFSHVLKAIAYFFGAAAYFSEFILLTDCFTKRVPHQEMFMAYCFGPLYILLGLSYLMGH